ncbi:MAG: agmatinase [Bacteroidales bacterium]|nr:agmatinase [Bacteroidales bacterium]
MKNFGGLEPDFCDYNNSKIVVLPIPYDGTSTWIKGANLGPNAILEASENMELYDIETDFEPYTLGIHTVEPVSINNSPESMSKVVYERTKKLLSDNKFVVSLGGEHSVSIGAIKAFAEKFDNLTILQIDAHTDLRNEYLGSNHNHACVMARAKEFAPIVQVGIRSMDSCELVNVDKKRVFFASSIQKNENWINNVVDLLTENVYLTFDLDGLDPSIMPSTGTPEPGGLLWYDVINLMEEVIKQKNLVGFDVVELCPNENNKAPDFLAAKFIYKTLSMKFTKFLSN